MSGQASPPGLKNNQPTPSGRGGVRPNSGRKPGKTSAPLREIARKHAEKAVQALVDILDDLDTPAAARVSAANSILDRGYGKPSQPIDGDGEGGAIVHRVELVGVMPK